jgi:hypothetical protein
MGTLKSMVMQGENSLTKDEVKELTPLEVKKYKTRTMLNEILSSKNIHRNTVSPWEALQKSSEVN